MSENEKRKEWEAKGRWGTHKEYLFRRKLARHWASEYEAIQIMADMVRKIDNQNQKEGKDDEAR